MSTEIDKAIPPTAKDYADAFYSMEDRVLRLLRLAKASDYLTSSLQDGLERKPGVDHKYLAEIAGGAAGEVYAAATEFDSAYLELFNDLVGRENAAGAGRQVRS